MIAFCVASVVLGVRAVPEEPIGDGVEPAGVLLGHTGERALVHGLKGIRRRGRERVEEYLEAG